MSLFSFTMNDATRIEPIKWVAGKIKYENHFPVLPRDADVATIIEHGIAVRNKVLQVVTNDTYQGISLFEVYSRSLNVNLAPIWEQMIVDTPHSTMSSSSFDDRLCDMFALYTTKEDRHELLQMLRNSRKPRELGVQEFWHMLQRFNSYVPWFPGDDTDAPMLTQGQLIQAFHDAMPTGWRDRFVNAGNSFLEMADAQIVRYFRQQETQAMRKMNENNQGQRKQANPRRRGKTGSPKFPRPRPQDKGKGNGTKQDTKRKRMTVIPDDTPCPIHPGAKHTWGQCYSNPKNPNRPSERHAKRAKHNDTKLDGMAATVNKVAATANKVDDLDEFLDDIAAINDDDPSDIGTYTVECYVNTEAIIANHYLNSISFPAEQDPCKGNLVFDNSFTTLCDEIYSLGANDITLRTYTDVLDSLRLRSIGVMTVGFVQRTVNPKPLRCLFDTGSDKTLFNRRALPKGANTKTVPGTQVTGIHGIHQMNQEVLLENVGFPEFSPTQRIPGPIRATVFDNPDASYDIILGMDLMQVLGIDVRCSTKTVTWNDLVVPFRPSNYFDSEATTLAFTAEDDPLDVADAARAGYKSNVILHSKYEAVDPHEVARQQKHLTEVQQQELGTLLAKYDKLFSGKLGCYPNRKLHLEVKEGARPFSCRPYPVSRHHEQVFKDELQHLCDIGVLTRCGSSEWLSPSFIIPKKDGRVRWISDFRELNKLIKRKVYHLPRIHDILSRRKGYEYFSKIDVSMHYYTFELDDESKELCTICTPFGNYRYNRLPMGVSQSPDFAQEIMEDLFRTLDETDVYIDDVGVFNDGWQAHLVSLDRVLTLLQDHNFTVNPLKCEWGVKETDWLGYWLTPTGLKPWRKKIEAILAIERPKTAKQLRSFLGAVNFYRDMYRKRSHILAPLTKMSGKKGLIPWDDQCQKAFDEIKALLAKEAFLAYPDHNLPFEIYVDASDVQLGAAIFQKGRPVAFYSRKLNAAQRNYTVGEKELLSIVETLKEFHTMLYGCQDITVFTDHKNNTFTTLRTQRVLRWRLFLEDYGVKLQYIKGDHNRLADALSRLPMKEPDVVPTSPNASYTDPLDSFYSMAIDDCDLLDCFINLPASSGIPFVLDYETISEGQIGDARLLALRQQKPDSIANQQLAPGLHIACYIPSPNEPWKIFLPTNLLDQAIQWYHLALGHIGISRLYDTMHQHLYHPDLRNRIDDLVSHCQDCQKQKNSTRGYGLLAPRQAAAHPWREVAVDLIGPWKLDINNVQVLFSALTIIDTTTNLVELVRLEDKTAAHVARKFEQTWLARYPKPTVCIHDQGGEFIGYAFRNMLQQYRITAQVTTAKNPQANALCERMHQTVGNTLRAMHSMNPPDGIASATQLVDMALANCLYATRATVHSGLRASPGSLAFARDMILDIPVVADWTLIRDRRQQLIDQRLIAANRGRFSHDYHVGDNVLKLQYKPNKLESRAHGPYRVHSVHTNGTVTIQIDPHTVERISIRRIKPFKGT